MILLSPIYQPLITTLFGLLLTELRRPIARLIMPVGIEPSDEIIESYHLFHRLILTILALIGFGFGLQWIGDSITGIAEFLNNAMANLTESGLNYRMWAELTGPIQAPLVQLLLSVLLICLAKPISQWLKPYKAK